MAGKIKMKRWDMQAILSQRTPYRIYFNGVHTESQEHLCKNQLNFLLFYATGTKSHPFFALTRKIHHGRITPLVGAPHAKYAGMVELADTLDLGAVTLVKVFPPCCWQR